MRILNGHTIFLTDAVGAAVSMTGLFFLYSFDDFFGMPKTVVRNFMVIAGVLILYALTIYLIKPRKWKLYLTGLAVMNILYCLYTLFQLVENTGTLTLYGYAYLLIEVAVIISLAIVELKRCAPDEQG